MALDLNTLKHVPCSLLLVDQTLKPIWVSRKLRMDVNASTFDMGQLAVGFADPFIEQFAELLGGSIGVESEVGKGSTFTVRVPMVYNANL